MASLQSLPSSYQNWLLKPSTMLGCDTHGPCKRSTSLTVRAEQASKSSSLPSQDRHGRRLLLAAGLAIAPWISPSNYIVKSFAAENKKGFLPLSDQKDGYEFLYPFGWQEVVIEGQDKVFKDVIEPLESVSVNLIPTNKQDIRDLGTPEQVAEALIKNVLAPPTQKTKLLDAKEHDVDGKIYYTFEFIAKAPNYTRHSLSSICINKGIFYTLTTGANERRWGKMKDKLNTVVDSFKIV
ncbi:psbP-like protein 1, chloroplastic isoform X2 [Impatiens glandulifera]|uniref:psbP-like protein 1, chloroplastic isoform X2 n=1 Tax=Impatiens glandulifera TaxID=253017 RepID=UPI001FB15152|nr:psbP-like protein 1, chloroplastic isoform X2 [Impatiens glandulifera]